MKIFFLFASIFFTFTPVLILIYSNRYKNYSRGKYLFMLKKNDKIYKIPIPLSLVKDKISKKYYIQLNLNTTQQSGSELINVINLDSSNYNITNSDSKFYDGILYYKNPEIPHIEINEKIKEINIHKSYTIEEIYINYNNKQLKLISDPKNINPLYKKYKLLICSNLNGKTTCYFKKAYGISFEYLKKEFDLKLDVEIDNKNKIVYIVKKQ